MASFNSNCGYWLCMMFVNLFRLFYWLILLLIELSPSISLLNGPLLTLSTLYRWSAPNYCYRCGNVAAIMSFDDYLNREFKLFREVEAQMGPDEPPLSATPNYFL